MKACVSNLVAKMPQPDLTAKDDERSTLKKQARRARANFFVPINSQSILSPVVELRTRLGAPFEGIAEAFVSNVQGLVSTVAIPYSLAHASSHDRHHQRLHSAARIRALMLEQKPGESEEEHRERGDAVARDAAGKQMNDFLASPDGFDTIARDTCSFLLRGLNDAAFADASRELLLQGVVLCWSAFEVIARDVFVATLNMRPGLTERLLADPVAKRRFELSKIPLETISAHGFDLSKRMGTLLAEQQDLSDLKSIKAVYEALFPEAVAVATALADPDLRLLAERRHLIVHKRGMVDLNFYQKTGGVNVVGERLIVTPDDLERHIGSCTSASTAVLDCVASTVSLSTRPAAN
ncbi:MAG: hypothetical protein H7176_01585 [Bdellovibrionales bacterium]|nr:hypothetical protein [Massilia sp.]